MTRLILFTRFVPKVLEQVLILKRAWYCRKGQSNSNAKEILTVAAGHELRFRQLCQQQGK